MRGKQPFFAYIATNAPHAPLQAKSEDEARYAGVSPDLKIPKYFGMIASIDDNVGRLLAFLRESGLEPDTLVVFMNDNGTEMGAKIFNAGIRGAKNSPWLGGTRASSFWRWPGRIAPADISALTAHLDFFPTIAEFAGARLSREVAAQIEGRSLVPLLKNPAAPWPERTFFTHRGRWPQFSDPDLGKFNNCSVRTPRWQLVSIAGGGQPAWELFDVAADPGELTDVAGLHPDIVARLAADYDAWWKSVRPGMVNERAVGPKVNPFKAAYWKQFGGGPTPEMARLTDPGAPATRP